MKAHKNFIVGENCQQSLREAAAKRLPLKITFKQQWHCQLHKSDFLALQKDCLVLTLPVPVNSDFLIKPTAGQEIAVSFEEDHYKYTFTTRVVGQRKFETKPTVTVPAMAVAPPEQIEQTPRRAFNRVPAPLDRPIPVTLLGLSSQGGRAYVVGQNWQGELHNLSAGNVGITMTKSQRPEIKPGQHFEIWFVPLPGQERICLRMQFHHATELPQSDRIMLGFRLVGQEASDDSRGTPCRIGRIADEYRHRQNA